MLLEKEGNWKAKPYSRLCSNHFLSSDYLYPKRKLEKVTYLKKNAVPSVFGNETFDQINISEKLDTKLILEVSRYFGLEKPELLPPYHIPEAVNKMPAEDHRLCLVCIHT